jgi:epoxyqueuosine reductase
MRRRLSTLGRELSSEYPGQVFRACVDTAPVLEREHAQRAGLGAIGKHTLLIAPEMGSWLLLGEIVTTLPLAPAKKVPDTFFDPCGPCTRCIDACPTKAISPWSVDATNCISYLTIEHRGPIDERYHEAMGDWIFGCDICQDVCPHNQPTVRRRQRAAETNPAYDARREGFDLLEVIGWDEAARRQAFTKSALKRATLAMMQRNAAIARKNQET